MCSATSPRISTPIAAAASLASAVSYSPSATKSPDCRLTKSWTSMQPGILLSAESAFAWRDSRYRSSSVVLNLPLSTPAFIAHSFDNNLILLPDTDVLARGVVGQRARAVDSQVGLGHRVLAGQVLLLLRLSHPLR